MDLHRPRAGLESGGRSAIVRPARRPAVTAATILLLVSPGAAAPSPTLAEPALARKLQSRISLTWTGQELGAGLARLADVQRVPVWLDRRADSAAEIDLEIANMPLAAALDELAADDGRDLGWTALRSVVYVGPRATARELATLAELARQALAKAPPDARRKWLTPGPWKIARLSEPHALLAEELDRLGAKLLAGAPIPHDVWAEQSLPGIAPVDRVVLLLAGFDLTAEISADGRQVRPMPIKRPVEITRGYPQNERTLAAIAELVAQDDALRVRKLGPEVEVAGRWEDHERLRQALRGVAATPAAGAEGAGSDRGAELPPALANQRFTLRIASKPVGPVLDQLAAQLHLTIEWDAALLAAMPPIQETLVSCDVREADLDGLLRAILDPAGLSFARNGQIVTIRATR
jgi:hypothetical protein